VRVAHGRSPGAITGGLPYYGALALATLGNLTLTEYWLIPVAFLTSTLAAVFGMGGGVPLITLMPGLVPVAAVIPLHAVTQLASNASRASFGWRHIELSLILPFLVGAVAGAATGGQVFLSLNLDWLPAIMGVVILLITWVPLPQVHGTGSWPIVLLGFYQTGIGMLIGATGPLGAALLLRRSQQRDWLVVNSAVYRSAAAVSGFGSESRQHRLRPAAGVRKGVAEDYAGLQGEMPGKWPFLRGFGALGRRLAAYGGLAASTWTGFDRCH
jgi:uncharacterized membrane protein YfcA